MTRTAREGLRARPPPPGVLSAQQKNIESCRAYRQAIKQDPIRYEQTKKNDIQRSRDYRARPKTEEERERINALSRIRAQRSRAKKKAQKQSLLSPVPATPPATRLAKERLDVEISSAKRAKWAAAKRKEREGWTSQKWRRHREKLRQAYYDRKLKETECVAPVENGLAPLMDNCTDPTDSPFLQNPFLHSSLPPHDAQNPVSTEKESSSIPQTTAPYTSKSSIRKARYRLKKTLLSFGKKMNALRKVVPELVSRQKTKMSPPSTPNTKTQKAIIENNLSTLKLKRDKKSLSRRRLLLHTKGINLPPQVSSPYKRKKTNEGTSAAVQYLEDISIHLPSKRSVGRKDKVQKKVLPKRLKRLHRDFLKSNPSSRASLRTMYRRKPHHIKTAKHQVLRQCLCEVCVNVDFKLDTLNRHLQQDKIIDGREILSELSLCESPNLACLDRKCSKCGVARVRNHIKASLSSEGTCNVQWYSWDMVKKDKGHQRKERVSQEGTLTELIEELLKELTPLSRHTFVHRWQHSASRTLLSKVPTMPNTAVVIMDFSENYLCKWQDEVQSAHWGYNQVTIHPTVMYYACPDCSEMTTEYMVFLSDDLNHDAHMVKEIVGVVQGHLHAKGITSQIFYSDGCAAQYKSKLPFRNISKLKLEWVFYGSRHGKSPCDACGGVVKSICDTDVKNGAVIQNAHQMYQHMSEHHAIPEEAPELTQCCHTLRCFKTIEKVDRSFPSAALNTVQGTRKIQHVRGLGGGKLLTRNLSCFCSSCLGTDQTSCTSADFVLDWEPVQITLSKAWQDEASEHHQEFEVDPTTCSPSPPPDFHHHQPSAVSRSTCFTQVQKKMQAAKTYQELDRIVRKNVADINRYPIHALPKLSFPTVSVDVTALSLMPHDAPPHHSPLSVRGDGNCLHRTLSLLVFGDEDRHEEMRVRVTMELVMNASNYVDPSFLARGSNDSGAMLLDILRRYADTPNDIDLDSLSHEAVLQHEIMATSKRHRDCGMWAIYAAANVLQTPLNSVFPDKGEPDKQLLSKRTVFPFHCPLDHTLPQPHHVMWTSSNARQRDEYWSPNHFVPLLPCQLESPEEEPVVSKEDASFNTAFVEAMDEDNDDTFSSSLHSDGNPKAEEFYLMTWADKKDYVCEVAQVLPGEELIHVSFMARQGSFFYWNSVPDHSWEDLATFRQNSRRVTLVLKEAFSSQRKQLFSLA